MADLRKTGKNNQRRGVTVAVTETIATSATMSDILFDLPVNCTVIGASALVTTASGTATDTVDIKVGSTVVANEVVVGVVGVQRGTLAETNFPTGGQVTVVAGADAPDTAGRIRVMLEYIELDVTSGAFVG